MIAWFQSLFRKFKSPNTGDLGESAAADFLINMAGCRILARNWRDPRDRRDELDLIATVGEVLVFVEVKTRSTAYFGDPSEAVSPAKQKRLIQAANDYLIEHGTDLEARFDVMSIVISEDGTEIDHMEDAFFPMA